MCGAPEDKMSAIKMDVRSPELSCQPLSKLWHRHQVVTAMEEPYWEPSFAWTEKENHQVRMVLQRGHIFKTWKAGLTERL